MIGSQLLDVNLMFSNQKVPNGESLDLSSIGLINVVPHFCPGVRKVFFGHWQSSNGSIPHSLCDESAFYDESVSFYRSGAAAAWVQRVHLHPSISSNGCIAPVLMKNCPENGP